MTEILLILLIIAACVFWFDCLKAREIALRAVAAYCRKLNLQLLDNCVALTGFWFKRSNNNKLLPWRAYAFEYSITGYERYQGKIVLLGNQIELIVIDSHIDTQQH